jgi:hypothetical protein
MADSSQVETLSSMMNPVQNQALVTPGGFSTSNQSGSDALMAQIQAQLTSQSGIISSSDKTIQDQIKSAISSVQTSNAASTGAIDATYKLKEQNQIEQNTRDLTSVTESQRGYATNTALLDHIKETGQKAINDLELQKQSLILSGNAAAASKISDLQVQEASMMVQNRQKVFDNLISMAGVAQAGQQMALSRDQFRLQVQNAETDLQSKMGTIALQYGIKVKAGDTLPDVVNRASTNAKSLYDLSVQDASLGLKLKQAQITLAQAQARAAGKDTQPVDFTKFFDSIRSVGGPGSDDGKQMLTMMVASIAKDPTQINGFSTALSAATKPQNYPLQDLVQYALRAKTAGVDFDTFYGKLAQNSSVANKDKAFEIAKNVYGIQENPNYAGLVWQSIMENPGQTFVNSQVNGNPLIKPGIGILGF